MSREFKTSIYITGPAVDAYRRLIRRYGAKLSVSAAVIALEQLEASKQLKYIDTASSEDSAADKPSQLLREVLHKIAEKGVGSAEEPLKIVISPSDEQAWEDLRKVVEVARGQKKARRIG